MWHIISLFKVSSLNSYFNVGNAWLTLLLKINVFCVGGKFSIFCENISSKNWEKLIHCNFFQKKILLGKIKKLK
jgi:hypothetical protein